MWTFRLFIGVLQLSVRFFPSPFIQSLWQPSGQCSGSAPSAWTGIGIISRLWRTADGMLQTQEGQTVLEAGQKRTWQQIMSGASSSSSRPDFTVSTFRTGPTLTMPLRSPASTLKCVAINGHWLRDRQKRCVVPYCLMRQKFDAVILSEAHSKTDAEVEQSVQEGVGRGRDRLSGAATHSKARIGLSGELGLCCEIE